LKKEPKNFCACGVLTSVFVGITLLGTKQKKFFGSFFQKITLPFVHPIALAGRRFFPAAHGANSVG